MTAVRLSFGLRDGKYIHNNQTVSGLQCHCVCPGCHVALVAKKGTVAHHLAQKASSPCSFSPETALHVYAKALITAQREIALPTHLIVRRNHEYSIEVYEELPAQAVTILHATEEQVVEDIEPDVQLLTSAG